MMDLDQLIRENIRNLKPYSSARDEFSAKDAVFFDANENPFGNYNRYPDPYQNELKGELSKVKEVPSKNIFFGNGSDEIIDLLIRIFCEPGKDKLLGFSPSYGMYGVAADINNIEMLELPLLENFQLDMEKIKPYLNDAALKLIFICSPNNPTGNSIQKADIEFILQHFQGIVVIDEAYIDFCPKKTLLSEINNYENLVVLQTLSKAWGLAGIRIGMAFTNQGIIHYLNKVKPPYNISTANQELAIKALQKQKKYKKRCKKILSEKKRMILNLESIRSVQKIFPSDANFILVQMKQADKIHQELIAKNLIVRNRSKLIDNCLRITIGKVSENDRLINALKNME